MLSNFIAAVEKAHMLQQLRKRFLSLYYVFGILAIRRLQSLHLLRKWTDINFWLNSKFLPQKNTAHVSVLKTCKIFIYLQSELTKKDTTCCMLNAHRAVPGRLAPDCPRLAVHSWWLLVSCPRNGIELCFPLESNRGGNSAVLVKLDS